MGKTPDSLRRIPAWLWIPVGLLLVAVIGYIDYLTGDYSILIFYAFPIALVAWRLKDWGAIIMSAAAGCARYISDFHAYSSSSVRSWNSIQDTLFLLIVGLLVSAIKRLIDDENKGKRRDKN